MTWPPIHPIHSQQGQPGRRGFVLLAVLVFILLISMVTVSLLFRNRAEETASAASGSLEQSWSAAFSGVQQALEMASAVRSGAMDWADNPSVFRERLVFEDGSDRWFFSVFSPGDSESTTDVRFGLTDLASRINLNQPGGADLAKVPRMTPEMVQFLRARLGQALPPALAVAESTPESPGDPIPNAMADPDAPMGSSTNALPGPVLRRIGRIDAVEDLLDTPGLSAELLLGEDTNLNGRLDPNEDDGDERPPGDNRDGRLDHGMAQYFTVGSTDPDLTAEGKPRLDINQASLVLLEKGLPPGFTNYLAALQRTNRRLTHPVDALEDVVRTTDESGAPIEIPSGITREELPRLLDLFTVRSSGKTAAREGLINLNTASSIVLATLLGMDLPTAESIVAAREGLREEQRSTPAWLLTEGILDLPKFKAVVPHLTTRAYQFRFHVIGYALPSGRYRVLEAEVDVSGETPVVTRLRDLTRLGLPFNLLPETLEQSPPAGAHWAPRSGPSTKRIHG
ncbi:MAG: general secretion pathway protein GspK [Verrucomicrobia bacterium]|nr:general secretion pathway protein GspK [Verrucomicrobiota bacterium]